MVVALAVGACGRPSHSVDVDREREGEFPRHVAAVSDGIVRGDGAGSAAHGDPPVPWRPSDPGVGRALERFRAGTDGDRLAIADQLIGAGTEESITGLILLLRELSPGEAKTAICQKLAGVSGADRQGFLLELLLVDADPEVGRALAAPLARDADAGLVARLAALHDGDVAPAVKRGVLELLAEVSADALVPALGTLVADPGRRADDPLVVAASRALAHNGSSQALDVLFRKLDGTRDPSESAALAGLVEGITRPGALHFLLCASDGNKVAPSAASRAIAIRALKNYPCQDTRDALARLASDPEPSVRAAARESAAALK